MNISIEKLIEIAALAAEALVGKDFAPVVKLAKKLADIIQQQGVGAIPEAAANSLYAALEAYEKSVFEKLEEAAKNPGVIEP